MYNNELYHYGVIGMKWGHRKAPETSTGKAKAAYKSANKEYSKSFNRAANYSARHPIGQHLKNTKYYAESNKRWGEAYDKAAIANKAYSNYTGAKRARKEAINRTAGEIASKSKFREKMFYNGATYRRAAKYVVDNNMPFEAAKKKAKGDALRNTAIFVSAFGAYAIADSLRNRK